MSYLLPSGAARLVSKASRRPLRGDLQLPAAEYPSNSRCFVHLDARLLPYWHTLFDICPALLKLDPPDGLNLFRSFMTWAYRNQLSRGWTYYLSVCRWLLGSRYRGQIDEESIEVFMTAAAAHWIHTDDSHAQGVVLAWQGTSVRVFDWKDRPYSVVEEQLPPVPWDFAWCPLSEKTPFQRWLSVP
ncbi:putative natural product biosynthesis protein [Pseudomonas sp. CCM 7893]|uniref:Putative natural product biosynthesis protein n=1 Tax=Pseudomonas spelaei TaxID=1055469 RepID=A0A6I3W6A0_9PSED|nr:putative natural product biosynthesis protein [Pseudomonas spelaei]MUF05637.1 putative natural product biosynthesis protein [Pseudomonas spelaei]QLG92947.1 putative natural product biosynthesis protein [Pseudomonas yamanorum]